MFTMPSDDVCSRYLFEYRHEGAEWAFEVWARDLDDAKARLRTVPFAKYQGELGHEGPIPFSARLVSGPPANDA